MIERTTFLTISAVLVAYVVKQNIIFFIIGLAMFIPMLLTQLTKVKQRQAEQLV